MKGSFARIDNMLSIDNNNNSNTNNHNHNNNNNMLRENKSIQLH